MLEPLWWLAVRIIAVFRWLGLGRFLEERRG